MAKIDDLYFDILFNFDKNKELEKIKGQLKNIKIDIGGDFAQKQAKAVAQTALNEERLAKAKKQTLLVEQRIATETGRTAIQTAKKVTEEAKAAKLKAQALYSEKRTALLGQASGRLATNIGIASANSKGLVSNLKASISPMRDLVALSASYFSVYTVTSFLKQLYTVRGEFDMQKTALDSILQSRTKANEIFSELKTQAVASPYTFQQIVSYTKQLSAYQVPTDDLTKTTKMLADMASGLGVDMQRIILAYGQVRSAAVLRGTELRQFTEAGIPMVSALADKFTKLEGVVVSTNDVFDKISNREVPFEMVKEVIEDLTDAGGKFYNMQEKQSETLAGKIAKLQDMYQIMLNDIGTSNDGLLKGSVDAVASLITNYKQLTTVLMDVAVGYGFVKLARMAQSSALDKETRETIRLTAAKTNQLREDLRIKSLTTQLTASEQDILRSKKGLLSAQVQELVVRKQLTAHQLKVLLLQRQITKGAYMKAAALAGETKEVIRQNIALARNGTEWQKRMAMMKASMSGTIGKIGSFVGTLAKDPFTWISGIIMVGTHIYQTYAEIARTNAAIVKNIKDSAEETSTDLQQFLLTIKDVMQRFFAGGMDNAESSSLWERLVEQIKKSSSNPDNILATLYNEEDLNKKIELAYQYVAGLDAVAARLKTTAEQITLSQDKLFDGGLETELNDYLERLDIDSRREGGRTYFDKFQTWYDTTAYEHERDELIKSISEATKDFTKDKQLEYASNVLNILIAQTKNLSERAKAFLRMDILGYFGDTSEAIRNFSDELKGMDSDHLFKELPTSLEKMKKAGINSLNDLSDAQKELWSKAKSEFEEKYPHAFDMFKTYIQQNPIDLLVRVSMMMNGQTGETAMQRYIKGELGKAIKGFDSAKSPAYRYAKSVSTDLALKSKIEEDIDRNQKIADAYRNIEKSSGTLNLTQLKSLHKAEENLVLYNKEHDALWGEYVKDSNKPDKDKTDQWLKDTRNRIKVIETAVKEYDRLAKVVGSDAAVKQLKTNEIYKALTPDERTYIRENGFADYLRDFLANNKALFGLSKDRQKLWEELSAKIDTSDNDSVIEAAKRQSEYLKERLKLEEENFKLYEKLLQASGYNTDFAKAYAFGDPKKMGEGVKSMLAKQVLEQTGNKLSIEELAGLKPEELKAKEEIYGNLSDAVTKYKQIEREEYVNTANVVATALKETATAEEQLANKRKEHENILQQTQKNLINKKGVEGYLITKENVEQTKDYTAVVENLKNEYAEFAATLLAKTSPTLSKLLSSIQGLNYKELTDLRKNLEKVRETLANLPQDAKTMELFNGEVVNVEDAKVLQKWLDKIIKQWDKANNKIEEQNPFEKIRNAFHKENKDGTLSDELKDLSDLKLSDWEDIADAVSEIGKAFEGTFDSISGFFSALGNDKVSDILGGIGEIGNSVGQMGAGIAAIASGNPMGAFQAANGLLGAFTAVFKLHDKLLERQIERLERMNKVLDTQKGKLERLINRQLGLDMENQLRIWENLSKNSDAFARARKGAKEGQAFRAQRELLKEQLKNIDKQRELEEKKKDSDPDQIQDYRNQIAELSDEIMELSATLLNSLYGLDLKDWAGNITDSIIEAFKNGEDGVDAFKKSANDMLAEVASNMVRLKVIEPALKGLQTYLFGADGQGGVFGKDLDLSDADMLGMVPYLKGMTSATTAGKELWDKIAGQLKEMGFDITGGGGKKDGLSAGIQKITEDQADLLASYINAIRADVAIIRSVNEVLGNEYMENFNAVAQRQLTELSAISHNTLRNAESAERIETVLNSVIASGANGKRLRV